MIGYFHNHLRKGRDLIKVAENDPMMRSINPKTTDTVAASTKDLSSCISLTHKIAFPIEPLLLYGRVYPSDTKLSSRSNTLLTQPI